MAEQVEKKDTTTEEQPEKDKAEVTFTAEQQEQLDAILKSRLARAREQWQQEAQAEADKARAEAERKALEEQGKFKELAEQQASELNQLKPKAKRVEQLETALEATLETQRAGVPDAFLALLDKMDVVEQLDWLAKHRAEVVGDEKGTIPTTPRTSTNGARLTREERKAAQDRQRTRGRYNL